MNTVKAIFKLGWWERFFNNIVAPILLVAMMLLVVCDVGGRYLFNRPVHGTLEITEFIMVGLVFLTLAHTQAIKAHIQVELLIGLMSRRKKLILDLVTYLLGAGIFALIAWQNWLSFLDSWGIREQTDGYIPFPVYPAKLVVPIGCFLLTLRFIVDIMGAIKEMRRKDVP